MYNKTVIIILVGIIIGLLSFIVVRIEGMQDKDTSTVNIPDSSISANLADIQKRLSIFEERMQDEKNRRIHLENLLGGSNIPVNAASMQLKPEKSPITNTENLTRVVIGNETSKDKEGEREKEIARFVEGGFSEDEAQWIVEKRENMFLDSLYSQWESRHQRYLEQGSTRKTATEEIRDRLGQEGYERYLKSIGSDVSAVIGGVMEGAPGELAGLKEGDEIISYNGERVYNHMELADISAHGELGEPVTLEIIRNGEKMQIQMERGPLGVNARIKAGVYYTSSLPVLPQ